jgi:16S rRNA (guanine527-N7)-methyltransferase
VFHVKRPELLLAADDRRGATAAAVSDRLQTFVSLLIRWNPTIRLVSTQDSGDLWTRHIEDALQLAPLMPPGVTQAIDLGSGGGLPGLVLAIATGVSFDLIEADKRKAAFLREAVLATEAPVTIHACRIEDAALAPSELVTARALASLPHLLDLAKPLLAADGICLFPKGERGAAEIAEAEKHWSFSLETLPSRTAPAATILRISHLTQRLGTAR